METDITKMDFVNCRRCVVGYHARCFPPELCDYDKDTLCTRLWTPHHNPGCHFKYTGRLKAEVRDPTPALPMLASVRLHTVLQPLTLYSPECGAVGTQAKTRSGRHAFHLLPEASAGGRRR